MDVRKTSVESKTGIKSSVETVRVDPELLKLFEALPDARRKSRWTPERDFLLTKYWPTKKGADVAKLLHVSDKHAATRFYELTGMTKSTLKRSTETDDRPTV